MLGFKLLAKIFIITVLFYILFCLLLYFYQDKLIYYPTKDSFYSCNVFDGAEKIIYNGTRFYYKYNSEKVVVVYHGNAGSACDRFFLKEFIEELNYSYIFVEYAGYAGDLRKPSKMLLLGDAENVNDFLKEKNFREKVLFGESLGTGIAAYHSSLANADKLILVAPFDSMKILAADHYPFYPSFLIKENYDNLKYLENFNNSIIIIHGTNDTIIPIKHSKILFDNLKTKNKKFVEVRDACHNNLYQNKKVFESIIEFLKD